MYRKSSWIAGLTGGDEKLAFALWQLNVWEVGDELNLDLPPATSGHVCIHLY